MNKLNKKEMNINEFIGSIDTKLYDRIRNSKGDAECRRYLKEHLQKQLTLTDVGVRSEQLNCTHIMSRNPKENQENKCRLCKKPYKKAI